jgi:hypothetical protein
LLFYKQGDALNVRMSLLVIVNNYYTFNQIAASAIKAQHAQRIVRVSTLGSDMSKTSGHLSADKPLEETGVAARIECPATFMDNLLW